MKLAFTIGCYALTDFIRLGVKQIKKLSPESPILLSDDRSHESENIKQIAEDNGCAYVCTRVRHSHFGGDLQAIANSIAFAEANKADIAIKSSQRFIFRKPEAIEIIRKTFTDPNILLASPGRPKVAAQAAPSAQGFSKFALLTDLVMFRVGAISAEDLLEAYRQKIKTENLPWSTFIESFIHGLHVNTFPGKSIMVDEFTNPTQDPIYLRRYQSTEMQYRQLANENGFGGMFPLGEFAQLEGKNYICKAPVV